MYFDPVDNMSNENNESDQGDESDDSIFGPENDLKVSPLSSNRSNK